MITRYNISQPSTRHLTISLDNYPQCGVKPEPLPVGICRARHLVLDVVGARQVVVAAVRARQEVAAEGAEVAGGAEPIAS